MKETGPGNDPKFFCSEIPRQNIFNKIEKSTNTGQEKKSLISTFAFFLTPTAEVEFLQRRLDTRLCPQPNLRFS